MVGESILLLLRGHAKFISRKDVGSLLLLLFFFFFLGDIFLVKILVSPSIVDSEFHLKKEKKGVSELFSSI